MDGANANNEALISSTGAETKRHRPVSLLLWIQRILFVWSDWRVPGDTLTVASHGCDCKLVRGANLCQGDLLYLFFFQLFFRSLFYIRIFNSI